MVIDDIFHPLEAKLIKAIPISRYGLPDQLIWRHAKDGIYSVKIGYHVITRLAMVVGSSYQNMPMRSINWKRIWSLRMPENIKAFIWRAVKGILPTVDNLVKKRVLQDPNCKVCGESEEDFNYCNIARQAWMLSPLGIRATETGVFTERD